MIDWIFILCISLLTFCCYGLNVRINILKERVDKLENKIQEIMPDLN